MTQPQRYGSGQYMMESLLPGYYRDSAFMNAFMMALGVEADFLYRLTTIPNDATVNEALSANGLPTPIESILSAAFVRLASGQGLNYWEGLLGIPSDPTLTDVQRRTGILNQIRNRGQSPTVVYINNLVQQYGVTSSTQDQFSDPTLSNYTFKVRITSPYGLPPNMTLIQNALNTLAPQHLGYSIVYSEPDWVATANHDWVDTGSMSWPTYGY